MAAKYTKHASASALMKDPGFWGPTAAVGAGVGLTHVQGAVERFQGARTKAKSYKEMLKLHPHLAKSRDAKQVRRLYNSLHNVNPTMGNDPLVAGAWVDNVLETQRSFGDEGSNQALLAAVKDLSGIRMQMSRARSDEQRMKPDYGTIGQQLIDSSIQRYGDIKREHGDVAALKGQIQSLQRTHKEQMAATTLRHQRERMAEAERRSGRKHASAEGRRLLAAIG